MAGKARLLEHLQSDYTEPVRDPLWRHIYLSRGLEAVAATPAFQKLGRIKQLGPAFLVYPGATHTRLAHSLGVFHLARRILIAILRQNGAPELSEEGCRAFLCAAMVHDLGHFPYAHSLKELPLTDHEVLTGNIVCESALAQTIRRALDVSPELVAAVVDQSRLAPGREQEIAFFRLVLSGVLDPDKLDYLNRDAYFCGVPYGVQDTDFVIDKLRPHPKIGIAIDEQGLSAVENVLFSRYLMYKSVYWHKTVRIATAMIKKAIFLALEERVIDAADLYGLDDEEFFMRFSALAFEPATLIKRVLDRRLLRVIWEEPFEEGNPLHRSLLDLKVRAQHERSMAISLTRRTGITTQPETVIVDIPEPISFEVRLEVDRGGAFVPFPEAGSLFDASVVGRFSRALRKLRIIVPEEVAASVTSPERILFDV